MKKVFLVAVFTVLGIGMSNAQDGGFAGGVRVAVPIGDFGDLASFGVGVEGMYLHPICLLYTSPSPRDRG